MSRILIAAMLIAVAFGRASVLCYLPTWPDHATSTSRASEANLTAAVHRAGPAAVHRAGPAAVHRAGPDDFGDDTAPRFGWPFPGSPTVVRTFHPPAVRYGPGHRGVDLASTAGAAVLAAGDGTVIFAGTVAGHGVLSVAHPGGLHTTYEPVSPTVAAGDRVARGQRIGTVAPGHPGCPITVCLHWGVYRSPERGGAQGSQNDTEQDRQYLDPLRLLAGARVRLLPIYDPAGSP